MSKILAIVVCFVITNLAGQPLFALPTHPIQTNATFVPDEGNPVFRNQIIQFVREAATRNIEPMPKKSLDELDAKWNNYYQKTDWSVHISVYHQGIVIGEGDAHGTQLSDTLKRATEASLARHVSQQLTAEDLNNYRFKVTFNYYPAHFYSFN